MPRKRLLSRKFRSRSSSPSQRRKPPRTRRKAEARKRARRVLVQVRRGQSLNAALRAEHISKKTALRHIGKYLRRKRTRDGKVSYVPIKSEHRIRMWLLTPHGYAPVSVGSRSASLLGKYSAAVQKYLRTGDSSVLAPFAGKRVAGHELVTDPQILLALAKAGELRLDDLYR